MAKADAKLNIARVLVALFHQGRNYGPNDLIEFPDEDIEKLEQDGVIDTSEAGVAYCKKELKKEVVKHVAVKEEGEAPAGKEGDK